jgi:hypothetical protein
MMSILLLGGRFEMSDINNEILKELSYMNLTGQDMGQNMGRCNYCGNHTLHLTLQIFTLQINHDNDNLEIDYQEVEEIIKKAGRADELTWLIQECVTCKGLLLKEKHIHEDEDEGQYGWEEFKILYPVTKAPSENLPSPVMKVYEAALKVKPIDPSAFAVLAGRILEAACNHEKAQGRNLAQKLEYLAKSERIPTTLVKMAQQVRLLRNLAAHDAEDEVTEKDVPIILEFLEAILEYLYVAPAKIQAVQKRLTRITPPENAGKDM